MHNLENKIDSLHHHERGADDQTRVPSLAPRTNESFDRQGCSGRKSSFHSEASKEHENGVHSRDDEHGVPEAYESVHAHFRMMTGRLTQLLDQIFDHDRVDDT